MNKDQHTTPYIKYLAQSAYFEEFLSGLPLKAQNKVFRVIEGIETL